MPFAPNAECFFEPGAEGDRLDDRRCYDLLSRECTPCHWVHCVFFAGVENPLAVACKISHFWMLFELLLKFFPVTSADEEFDKWLIILVLVTKL